MYLEKSDKVEDYKLKQRRLAIPFNIVGNATPASKSSSNDLHGVIYLRLEGQTSEADAVDSGGNFTTPDDNAGGGALFGILLAPGKAARKVIRASVEQRSGSSATNLAQAVSLKGASSSGVTASGNLAVEVQCAGLDLSSETLDAVLVIEYMIE